MPDILTDDQFLFLTDIFPSGYSGIDWAQMKAGFGCGPVGLMAQKVAWLKGASKVIALDVEGYRLALSKKVANTETINA